MKHRSRNYALAMLCGFLCASLTAQASMQMNKIEFSEHTLDNGLHVILHHDKSAPIVSTLVHYRVGSRDEQSDRTGFAHFFEHLMFEGTGNIPRASMDKYIQEAGGNLNAYTSFDETVYFFRVPSNELPLALWIESQRMRQLLVDSTGVETQRGVVKEERNQRYDNQAYGSLFEKLCGRIFAGGSYAWTPIGSAQHIDSAAIPEFVDFYDKFYLPSNATLVVAGDFDEDLTLGYIERYFGQYGKATPPKRNVIDLPPLEAEMREEVMDSKAQLPAVFIAYRGPEIGAKDSYAMDMLLKILSTGESSRLYQRLVSTDQIAVQASAFPWNFEHAGIVALVGVAGLGKDIGAVETTIYEEVQRVVNEGVSDEEFEKARNIKEAEFVQGKKDVFSKSQALARYYTYYGNADLINTEIDYFTAVTKEDLQRVAKKYFGTDNRVVLTYQPSGGQGGSRPSSGRGSE